MPEVAVVGMGIAVPGASSPTEFWRLLKTGKPQFSEPSGNYRLDSFWSADPDAEDRGYARVSGFLTGLCPHPRLVKEIAEGLFTRSDSEAVWLRHCLLQASEEVAVRDGDRGCCVIGGTGLTSRRLDEVIVTETAAHEIAGRLAGGGGTAAGGADGSDGAHGADGSDGAHGADGSDGAHGADGSDGVYGVDGAYGADAGRLRSLLHGHFGHAETPPAQLLPDQVVRAAIDGLVPGGCAVTVVDTACSSALFAIDLGTRHLLAGDCEIAYCGGMSGVTPRYNTAFAKIGWLSRRGRLRVFDRLADGTLFSEAAAVVVLKTLRRALADKDPVLGLLVGFGASSDGSGRSVCAASPTGQSLCIQRAHRAAGVDASQVDWVVAHGTGTAAGDAAELAALAATAPPTGRVCASHKAVIGNPGWSAGAVSVIHALLALGYGRIPAHRGLGTPVPDSPIGTWVDVPVQCRPWIRQGDCQPRTVGVSSFGFGGTNGHLLIREYAPRRPVKRPLPSPATADPAVLVAWAAHLPGEPSRREVERMLATGTWTCPRSFGRYESPPFDEIRLPAPAARSADRSQLMALHLAAMLVAEYGELWSPVRDTTGVIAALTGPVPLAVGNLLRCYASELTGLFTGADAEALAAFLRDARAETPPTSKDTLPGIMANIMAARLANRYDLHGLTMLVDSGRSSGHTALDAAGLYLATGALDMALVLAVNVAVPPGLARLTGAEAGRIAEGAFLLALTRSSVARRHGWQVYAEIPRGAREPAGTPNATGTTFLAADAVVSLLAGLHRNSS
jgi:3-oxoacyl-(acyl-carrier-protein) synthase